MLYRFSAFSSMIPRTSLNFRSKTTQTYRWRIRRAGSVRRVGPGRGQAILRLLPFLLLAPVAVMAAWSVNAGAKSGRPALRYLFWSGGDEAAAAAAAAGWNLLDVSSKVEADALPPGTRGLMWLGDYDNTHCTWERTDDELARRLEGTKEDPHVAGFLFSDEPDPFACPSAPAQHRARSRLIHQLSGNKLTVAVIDSNSGAQTLKQMPLWKGAADRLALDPYPCYRGKPCDYGWIRSVSHAADAAH